MGVWVYMHAWVCMHMNVYTLGSDWEVFPELISRGSP